MATVRSVVKIALNVINKNTDEQTLTGQHDFEIDETRENGTDAATQTDAVYSEVALSLAGAAVTLDLQGLTDEFGAALNLAKISWIAIRNKSTVAGEDLTVGGAAANPWEPFVTTTGDTVVVPDGGSLIWQNPTGETVDATNSDLKLDPGANTFTIDLLIVGTKA